MLHISFQERFNGSWSIMETFKETNKSAMNNNTTGQYIHFMYDFVTSFHTYCVKKILRTNEKVLACYAKTILTETVRDHLANPINI